MTLLKKLSICLIGSLLFLTGCSSDGENSAAGTDTTVQPVGPTPGTQEDLVVSVGDRVFFELDSSSLSADARRQVESWASWLEAYPLINVMIEGHADERGTREYNYALGDRRAAAVKGYLVQLGIDPGRVSTTSFGKDRPEVLGSNQQSWAQNRRGVMVVQ